MRCKCRLSPGLPRERDLPVPTSQIQGRKPLFSHQHNLRCHLSSSLSVIPAIHPDNSFISTHRGVSTSDLVTGQSVQLPTRVADIQISATGGEFTEQTSIQIRRGSTITDFPPVDDDVEQFPAREEEEVTETEISREGQPIVPSSRCEDPLRYEDPVMQISGTGHWFLEGWIGDHSVEFLVDSGSSVTPMSDICYRNLVHAGVRRTPSYSNDATPDEVPVSFVGSPVYTAL